MCAHKTLPLIQTLIPRQLWGQVSSVICSTLLPLLPVTTAWLLTLGADAQGGLVSCCCHLSSQVLHNAFHLLFVLWQLPDNQDLHVGQWFVWKFGNDTLATGTESPRQTASPALCTISSAGREMRGQAGLTCAKQAGGSSPSQRKGDKAQQLTTNRRDGRQGNGM